MNSPKNKDHSKRLGRGLSSLLGETSQTQADAAMPASPDRLAETSHQFKMIPVELITTGPWQPRQHFDEEGIEELAKSIAQKGIIQPVLLRINPENNKIYQIVAGERRWRAAQRATLHEIPALIQDFSDKDAAELALVENIQRRDLSVVEEAESYHALMSAHGYTQEECAEMVGKSRSHIANLLRLLHLPEQVRKMLMHQQITMGQARPLIGHPDAEKLARQIADEQLSARQVEALIRKPAKKPSVAAAEKSNDVRAIEARAQTELGLSLSLDWNNEKEAGKIAIRLTSLDQLEDVLTKLGISEG